MHFPTGLGLRAIQTAVLALLVGSAHAREGMWLPPALSAQAKALKKAGLRLSTTELYNPDGTGLNAAVVRFGGGCTGEMISGEGLLLTNHHCGYGTVQGLSSRTADYFAAGFWAMSKGQEIPCPGLTVTFVRRVVDVTAMVSGGIPETQTPALREAEIGKRLEEAKKALRKLYGDSLEVTIRPHLSGNEYWAELTQTYRDVRLVGFPPNGIGSFGGDTDNWSWPRHTGDFSLFRVYADAANKPAAYAPANKPYRPGSFFTINAKGYKEGTFTMVYGFPGQTQEYISAAQLRQIQDIQDPIRVGVRTERLKVWTAAMQADRDVFLKYTGKRAGVANYWKKWQGELRGLRLSEVVKKKEAYEAGFRRWAAADATLPYADYVLDSLGALTAAADKELKAETYITEAVLGVELIAQAGAADRLIGLLQSGVPNMRDTVIKATAGWAGFFRNYDSATDKRVFAALMPLFMDNCSDYVPGAFKSGLSGAAGDFGKWADGLWSRSVLADSGRWNAFIRTADGSAAAARLADDPAVALYRAISSVRREKLAPRLNAYNAGLSNLNRLYLAARLRADSGQRLYYPDANSTLRLAWGKVRGVDPDGPAGYSYQTNLDGAIAKDNPAVEEFRVPQKLKDLHAARDYGRWKKKRSVPIAFIADNHTTGGNSGSPVLNKRGELIGTNFDRIWEGTMSDLYFDPALCRNITLDVRYTLFVIEKFGGAGWLLEEMKIVR